MSDPLPDQAGIVESADAPVRLACTAAGKAIRRRGTPSLTATSATATTGAPRRRNISCFTNNLRSDAGPSANLDSDRATDRIQADFPVPPRKDPVLLAQRPRASPPTWWRWCRVFGRSTMKCQQCEKPATFHITELTGGEPQELHLCEDHARRVPHAVGRTAGAEPQPGRRPGPAAGGRTNGRRAGPTGPAGLPRLRHHVLRVSPRGTARLPARLCLFPRRT